MCNTLRFSKMGLTLRVTENVKGGFVATRLRLSSLRCGQAAAQRVERALSHQAVATVAQLGQLIERSVPALAVQLGHFANLL